jgi:hypothetical protein
MTSQYAGYESMPEEPFTPTKYRVRFRCNRCSHEYFKVANSPNIADVPCPKAACKEAIRSEEIRAEAIKLAKMLDEQRAPGQIGNNVVVKAIDKTANIVMEDYNITDIKDNIRQGESAAPKLAPKMQAAADNFFNHPAVNSRKAKQIQALGQRAIAGAFAHRAINPHALVGGQKGEKALTYVRTEKIRER